MTLTSWRLLFLLLQLELDATGPLKGNPTHRTIDQPRHMVRLRNGTMKSLMCIVSTGIDGDLIFSDNKGISNLVLPWVR
ncbi:MAG: hypothetical protein ACLR5T_03530 [Veillonella sp.]